MIKNFENIPVELPELAILKRMGYNRHLTGVPKDQAKKINNYIASAYSLCMPAGRSLRLKIKENDGFSVTLESVGIIYSASVAKLLHNSIECLFLAARVNPLLLVEIEQFIKEKNGVAALIYDAVASEVVDASLAWMIRRIGMDLSRLGLRPTPMRYSAGYGDFPLENQRLFYTALKMDELGVALSENFIFAPEKTVTALCGIE